MGFIYMDNLIKIHYATQQCKLCIQMVIFMLVSIETESKKEEEHIDMFREVSSIPETGLIIKKKEKEK